MKRLRRPSRAFLGVAGILLLVASAGSVACSSSTGGGFELTTGLFELCFDSQGRLIPRLVDRSPRVPHPLGRWESFGFIIVRENEEPFQVYTVLTLPGKPVRMGGEWARYSPEDALVGMKSAVRTIERAGFISFGLDHDDPMGEYTVEVFANDRRIDTIRFLVSSRTRSVYGEARARSCRSISSISSISSIDLNPGTE